MRNDYYLVQIFYVVGLAVLIVASLSITEAHGSTSSTSSVGSRGVLFDRTDPVGDDKGPGYYQYPLDKRIKRGTYDIKRFTVSEEDSVYVFTIQTREYIMTQWPDTQKSEEQGFVANVFDIYIDLDGRPNTGYKEALPSRELRFADDRGWEKMILITPLSMFRAYDLLKSKTDDLAFQDMIQDIILPDYVQIQRDKIIVRISKKLIGSITSRTGFQCLALGFAKVISPNRLLNMDVRTFATPTDFGGGLDTYGDPPVMDLLMPDGQDQYETLRAYQSQPSRYDIVKAKIPFLYSTKNDSSSNISPSNISSNNISSSNISSSNTSAIPQVPIKSGYDKFSATSVASTNTQPITKRDFISSAGAGSASPKSILPPAIIVDNQSISSNSKKAVQTSEKLDVRQKSPTLLALPTTKPPVIQTTSNYQDEDDETIAEAGFMPLPRVSSKKEIKSTSTQSLASTKSSLKSAKSDETKNKMSTKTYITPNGFIPLKKEADNR